MEKKNRKNNKKYKNVILYGFMCSGKTTIAKKLSKKLALKFIDTDLIFEKKYGSIKKFVERYGFKKFREIEKKIFRNSIKEKDAVISAGGGIFPSKLVNSLQIFLNPPFSVLEKRFFKNKKERPLLTNYPLNKKEIIKLYLKRIKKYRKAGYEIKETDLNKIINLIKSYYENPQT
jgi:shikimate kinase